MGIRLQYEADTQDFYAVYSTVVVRVVWDLLHCCYHRCITRPGPAEGNINDDDDSLPSSCLLMRDIDEMND